MFTWYYVLIKKLVYIEMNFDFEFIYLPVDPPNIPCKATYPSV